MIVVTALDHGRSGGDGPTLRPKFEASAVRLAVKASSITRIVPVTSSGALEKLRVILHQFKEMLKKVKGFNIRWKLAKLRRRFEGRIMSSSWKGWPIYV